MRRKIVLFYSFVKYQRGRVGTGSISAFQRAQTVYYVYSTYRVLNLINKATRHTLTSFSRSGSHKPLWATVAGAILLRYPPHPADLVRFVLWGRVLRGFLHAGVFQQVGALGPPRHRSAIVAWLFLNNLQNLLESRIRPPEKFELFRTGKLVSIHTHVPRARAARVRYKHRWYR